MRNVLLLCLALGACKSSDAADLSAIQQTGDVRAQSNLDQTGADTVDGVGGAEGPSRVVSSVGDDSAMWSPSTEQPIRGAAARQLATKFPIASPDDLAVTMMSSQKRGLSWAISYETNLSLDALEKHYRAAYAAKSLGPMRRLSIDDGVDQALRLEAESGGVTVSALCERKNGATSVVVFWDDRSTR